MRFEFRDGEKSHGYVWSKVKNEICVEYDEKYIVDNLILHLFGGKSNRTKNILWDCFGDIIVNNLENNINNPLNNGWTMCEVCGVRIKQTAVNNMYCYKCARKEIQKRDRERKRNSTSKNTPETIDIA
jgi:hypothetical protein